MKRKILEDSSSTKDSLVTKPIFKTKRYYRKHSKFSKDNLLSRIKSKFMKSLIAYLNNLIKAYGKPQLKVRNINAEINSCTSKTVNSQLFQKKLIDLFIKEKLNDKYIRVNKENYNKRLKALIDKKDKPFLDKFLKQTYKDVMQQFYLQKKDDNVYKRLYEVETNETVYNKLCEVKMKTFDEFIGEIETEEYKTALNNFSKEIFTYVQDTDKK
jgi:hypothetical protein